MQSGWGQCRSIGPRRENKTLVPHRLKRIQHGTSAAENAFQIRIRLLLPVDKCRLHGKLNLIFSADFQTFSCRQAGVDDPVPMIRAGIIIQSGFYRTGSLFESGVTDRMEFDLQTGPVGCLTEISDLSVTVVQNAFRTAALIRFQQCRVTGTETAVQGIGKTPADPGQLSSKSRADVHGLGKMRSWKPL